MTSKHTPGPWRKNGRLVVSIPLGSHSSAEAYCGTEANARLIAAAPDLLEVVLDIVSDCKGNINSGLYDLAVAAIAKATGGDHD